MTICPKHWELLRDAIAVRGLSQFVAMSGAEAAKQLVDEVQGTTSQDVPYDPLMKAFTMICTNGLKCGGLYLMGADLCVLSELEAKTPAKAEEWITPCTDGILEDFKNHGWIKVQIQ